MLYVVSQNRVEKLVFKKFNSNVSSQKHMSPLPLIIHKTHSKVFVGTIYFSRKTFQRKLLRPVDNA